MQRARCGSGRKPASPKQTNNLKWVFPTWAGPMLGCNPTGDWFGWDASPAKIVMSHMNAASPRQSLVKGERLTRYELAAVMVTTAGPAGPVPLAPVGGSGRQVGVRTDIHTHDTDTTHAGCVRVGPGELAAARTQATAVRNCAVDHREPGVLAGLTDARVQWPAHRHERGLHDHPPAPAR